MARFDLHGSGSFGLRALGALSGAAFACFVCGVAVVASAGLVSAPVAAQSSSSSSLHAGSVTMNNPEEKQLFERLLCMCGSCQRLPLSSCVCSVAEEMRAKIRDKLAAGVTPAAIQDDYRSEFGVQAIAIPSDHGLDRALWAVPLSLIALAAGLLVWRGKKWVLRPAVAAGVASAGGDGYDDALDNELRKLDE